MPFKKFYSTDVTQICIKELKELKNDLFLTIGKQHAEFKGIFSTSIVFHLDFT